MNSANLLEIHNLSIRFRTEDGVVDAEFTEIPDDDRK